MWKRSAICLVLINLYQGVCAEEMEQVKDLKEPEQNATDAYIMLHYIMTDILKDAGASKAKNSTGRVKIRDKRQVGKFAEASKVDNTKSMRMYLTMLKNIWAKDSCGGTHPFHPDVPKPVVKLYKQRIMAFFFPPIGQDPDRT